MASTYTTNTGIELIATGEQSGTWGDTTNVNLQIIDRLTNGVGSIALSGTTHTLTTTEGTLSDGQYAVLVFGGSPSGTNTVTVSPNDQQKVFIVKNGSGQTVVLSQGSGANVTLLNGDSKIVYCDGAGASAAVVDVTADLALSDVNIDGGSIDGVTLGTNSPVTEAQIDNLNFNGNAITSTDTNGNIAITPNGTGEVDISKVDINGGTIDGTVIGGSTPAAGGFTNVTVTGTVDGRDVAADGTKLDGIEALADVTDTANVTAAGALMDSELTDIAAVKALDQGVATTDSPTFVEVTAAQYNSTEALPDIKPSLNLDFANTKQLDPRITYTRGSTATYYDGKTFAKAEENLLRYSQEFDNAAWGKANTTVTANSTAAPDGTTTAETLTADGTSDVHLIQQQISVISAKDYVFSFFAKANTNDFVQLRFGGLFGGPAANFDLSAGTVGTTTGTITAAIKDVGNGWYKCSGVTDATSSGSTAVQIYIVTSASAASAETNTLSTSIFLWGAQLEQRSALTDYTATTDQPITNYVPALQTAASGEARFDHDPITGESKGFLIEEQRTNLLTYSEQFDDAAWSKTRVTITANAIVAPDGTLTGDKLVETTDTGAHYLLDTASITSGNVYTASVYLKAAERTVAQLAVNASPSAFLNVDLSSGEVITPVDVDVDSYSVVAVGNGWYRASLTFTASATVSQNFIITLSNGSPLETTFDSYTGDGYSGIYIWGAQLEEGSFPTSYIPTVASQVTRSPDAASMTGTNFSSWYRQDEGSFFSSVERDDLGADGVVFSTSQDGASFGPRHQVVWNTSNVCRYACVDDSGSVAVAGMAGGGTTSRVFSVGYKTNDFAATGGGATPATDTSGNVPVNNAELWLGRYNNGGTVLNGHIKKLAYYPKRLSNATLQALTEE